MTRKRKTTDDEKALFREVAEQSIKPVLARKSAAKSAAKAEAVELDGNTAARLKKGAQAPEAKLDLHGLTESSAHGALLSFLERAQRQGLRLVLVVTGKGNKAKDESAAWMMRDTGVLKEMVPRWLREKDFARLTSGHGAAHRKHGGDGALYVYVRKIK